MIEVRKILQIAIEPGELVVSATYHRDSIIVVTDRGSVYKVILIGLDEG